jgi:serine/threonine-protein kinase
MTLAAGTRLGPYEILAPLGAGGMGEVYRARDGKLHRDVAIKVLPELFAADAERLARFQREAQVLASLNHPHIAAIYGLEESGATAALVLELVPGETLAERIASGPIPVEEALVVAHQVSDALEAAHEKGIVHRDLKPANVKITPDGKVKVLDFGLAKALSSDGSSPDVTSSPTITAAATQAGVVIGTAAYMSPEQARGRPVDRRTDIWAFGAVLYEMLAGKRCFEGDTVSDVLAAVLRQDPDWRALPPDTPASVRFLLHRCLERDTKKRLRDIGDAWAEGISEEPAAAAPASEMRRGFLVAGTIAVLLALAAGFAAARWTSRAPAGAAAIATHSVIPLPPDTRLSGWASPVLALSRDGRSLAFVAEKEGEPQRLWVHRLDLDESRVVPDSDSGEGPFFSPDGQWIGFAVNVSQAASGGKAELKGEVRKYSLSTGLTQSVAPIPDYHGGTWAEDGSMLVAASTTQGLWRIPAGGGKPDVSAEKVIWQGREDRRPLSWPQALAGGAALVTFDGESRWGGAAILDLQTRSLKKLAGGTSFSRYAGDGRLLMLRRDRSVLAAPFDARTHRITGPAVAVLREVATGANGAGALAVSENGTLVYATGYLRGSGFEQRRLVRLSERGEVDILPFEPDTFGRVPQISPDGRTLAVMTADGSVLLYDLARGVRSRLPVGNLQGQSFSVIWSPDGESVTFTASSEGGQGWSLVRQKADGSGPPEELVPGGEEKYALTWTPDARSLIYTQFGSDPALWIASVTEKAAARRLVEGFVGSASISPDGHWLAYDRQGIEGWETFVERLPGPGRKVAIAAGGRAPRWSPDGRSLYYRIGDRFLRVRVTPGEKLEPTAPVELFRLANVQGYAVAPDGKGFFAVVQSADSGIVRELHLVTNWFSELERLAPSAGGKP